jgi:thymidylate synthase ThyX
MPDYADVGHRPHAVHAGETPEFKITHGPESIDVTLDTWGPQEFMGPMLDYLQSNWGEDPSDIGRSHAPDDPWLMHHQYLDACFGGRTLQQVLEGITFWFTVDGVTRAMTHEMVRARFAAFMQHGGRDNDWRHRDWTMPETIRRVIRDQEMDEPVYPDAMLVSCINDSSALDDFLIKERDVYSTDSLDAIIREHLSAGKRLYAALVDAGIPWQDARRLLPIGTQTYIHGIFNFVSLRDFLANRMEFIMDWEINCVAQLMYREILMKCPPLIGKYLGSHSDRQRKAAFEKLESWPPDGKYPHSVPFIERTHRPEQMPFWVLAQSSLDGGPVVWIPTNGTYPHDHPDAPKPR